MKVYIVHECNYNYSSHYILGVYSSREKAVAALMEEFDDLIYDERDEEWEHANRYLNSDYYYISVYTLDE